MTACLHGVLAQRWEEPLFQICGSDQAEWFGDKGGFANMQLDGAGERSIHALVGGAFAKGHGVRDTLAILNKPGGELRLADGFTNLAKT